MVTADVIKRNYASVLERIHAAARRCGRAAGDVTLVAVTKTVDLDEVGILHGLGARDFGENRVQELQRKMAGLTVSDARWHMIGHLQTNKAAKVAGSVELIHSVESLRLAQVLHQAAVRRGAPVSVLVEVNVSGEESKSGLRPEALEEFWRGMEPMTGVQVLGLMTMAPFSDSAETSRPFFRVLRELRDRYAHNVPANIALRRLSMGMTRDFEVAIEEGADIVRVGTALFEENAHA